VHVLDVAAAVRAHAPKPEITDLFARAAPAQEPSRDAVGQRPRVLPVTSLVARDREVVPAPDAVPPGGGRGADFGTFVHAVLEDWDFATPLEAGLRASADRAFARLLEPPTSEERGRWAAEVARIAREPALAELRREALEARRALREVPFLVPFGADSLTGTIDLLIEGKDGSLRLLDYKTGRVEDADAPVAERHRAQAALYAWAAAQATGRPVRLEGGDLLRLARERLPAAD
jgi:ATP-dependent exoDNAse (exonuclease V) beta subunit